MGQSSRRVLPKRWSWGRHPDVRGNNDTHQWIFVDLLCLLAPHYLFLWTGKEPNGYWLTCFILPQLTSSIVSVSTDNEGGRDIILCIAKQWWYIQYVQCEASQGPSESILTSLFAFVPLFYYYLHKYIELLWQIHVATLKNTSVPVCHVKYLKDHQRVFWPLSLPLFHAASMH